MDKLELEFTNLAKEYKDTIYSVCYMFSDDSDEVADLFQMCLINLWKGLSGFKGESTKATWVWRVSLNTCISAYRKRHKGTAVPLTMDINLFVDSDEDSRQIQMLRNRIKKLGPFDRAIVLLWLENISYEEIGSIVGMSAKNVSVRLVRIREKLKNMSNE